MITPNQVHVDTALGNIAVAYTNPAFVNQSIFKPLPVDKQSDFYYTFSKQHFRSQPDSLRPDTDATILPVDMDARKTFFCDGHGNDVVDPDVVQANADPGADLDIELTEKATANIRLNQEILLASMISTTNISQNATLSGTSQWSDQVNSDPILVIDQKKSTIRNSTGLTPNTLMLPEPVYLQIRNHPRIIDRVKYTGAGVRNPLSPDELAQAFGLSKVVIAASLKQSANMGQADALTSIWGNKALLYYDVDSPGKRKVALGYTFVWMVTVGANGKMQADLVNSQGGFIVKRYRKEARDSDVIGVRYYYDMQFVEPKAAYLFVNPVASLT